MPYLADKFQQTPTFATATMNRKIDEALFINTYQICVTERRSYDDFAQMMGLEKRKALAAIKRFRARGMKLPNLIRNAFRERDLQREFREAYDIAVAEGWDYQTLANRLDLPRRAAISYRHILIQEGIELPDLEQPSDMDRAG